MQELTVYGFVRIYTLSMLFPDELVQLCMTYFMDLMDSWNIELLCQGFKMPENNTLTITKDNSYGDRTAFGSRIIHKGQKSEWKLKLTRDISGSYGGYDSDEDDKVAIFVGISPFPIHQDLMNRLSTDFFVEDAEEWNTYAYYTYNGSVTLPGQWKDQEPKGRNGDIVEMT